MISGIYKIQSLSNPNKIYIGSAIDFARRKRQHLHLLRKKLHHSPKIQNHYNKYGEDDLVFNIITICFSEQLIATEQYYIDSLCPWFNCSPIAGSSLGIKRSKETKKRIATSSKGRVPWNKGKKMSKEYCMKLSKIHTGEIRGPHSKEHKRKIKEGNKYTNIGKTPWNKGIKTGSMSKESSVKKSKALKGRKFGPYPKERGDKIKEAWAKKRLEKDLK